jgi:hypothetical protein
MVPLLKFHPKFNGTFFFYPVKNGPNILPSYSIKKGGGKKKKTKEKH